MSITALSVEEQPSQLLPARPWWPGQPLPAPPQGLGALEEQGDGKPTLLLIDRRRAPQQPGLVPLSALLAPDEMARLMRLQRQDDRDRTLLGRGGLRLVLGLLLERDPAGLPLVNGRYGKPELAEPGGPQFNVSHAGDLILLAFHPDRPVGVDVERERPDLDWRPIARRMFGPADLADLEALPETERGGGFLQRWCRLEARLKASGEGLSGAERLQREGRLGIRPRNLWDVAVPSGYRAAVALAAPWTSQGPSGGLGGSRSSQSAGVSG